MSKCPRCGCEDSRLVVDEGDNIPPKSACRNCGLIHDDWNDEWLVESERMVIEKVLTPYTEKTGKTKTDPVEMPAGVVDYWVEKAIEYKGEHPVACDYCDEPIEKGDRFFYVMAVNNEPSKKIFIPGREMFINVSKRGHVSHLKPAPEREWMFDPAKQQPQPWEADPSIPAPPGWEEWKRKNRGINYG